MPTSRTLSQADQALATALAAWAGTDALALARRFRAAKDPTPLATIADPSADPIAGLRALRAAQLGPDPSRVHPSWYVRALQDEAPSVRSAVTAAAPEPLRSILMRRLHLAEADLIPDRPAEAEAVGLARVLWTERLVGDLPDRDDDPPAIAAITRLGPIALYRLHRLCGLAKLSMLADRTSLGLRPSTSARVESFSARLADPVDPRLIRIASDDWSDAMPLGRHRLAGLGLATLGRLLAAADPHRTRWALQHLPYPIAKRLRLAASQPPAIVPAVLAWETRTFEVARDRLTHPSDPSSSPDREGGRLA